VRDSGDRRLAIIDLSPAGHQPMQGPDTENWIIFNGKIYNSQRSGSRGLEPGVGGLCASMGA
jgi:asparagine synthetase B (glutamine-hydrolysing)